MNEQQKITECITELNTKRNDIVNPVKKFVEHCKKTGQQTVNIDRSTAEKMLVTAQASEQYISANIPDLIAEARPTSIDQNTVTILSPSSAKSPYKTATIPIEFEVKGSYHDAGKEYAYVILVVDKTGKEIFKTSRVDHINTVTYPNIMTQSDGKPLQDGEYHIKIFTRDLSSQPLAESDVVTFVIDTRASGGPSFDILKPNNSDDTFKEGSHIELLFTTTNFTMPYQYKVWVSPKNYSGSSMMLMNASSHNTTESKTISRVIPTGKYDLVVICKDSSSAKPMSRSIEIEIVPKDPSRDSSFMVYFGDTRAAYSNNSRLVDGSPVTIRLRNENHNPLSYCNWKFEHRDDWIDAVISPNTDPIQGGHEVTVTFYLNNAKYTHHGHPPDGKIRIKAYSGKSGKTEKGGVEILFIHH